MTKVLCYSLINRNYRHWPGVADMRLETANHFRQIKREHGRETLLRVMNGARTAYDEAKRLYAEKFMSFQAQRQPLVRPSKLSTTALTRTH